MDPLVSAVALGFVLGLQHATDGDHLVAVATILTRERRFRHGALVGLFWGLGHMVTLTAGGLVVVGLGLAFRPAVGAGLEVLVAVMLVVLGVLRLREAWRGADDVAPGHVAADHGAADHDHGGRQVFHSHPHAHGASTHAHPHVHPSPRLLGALSAGGGHARRQAFLVGTVHGVAGSAAVSLLVLATLPHLWGAALYLVVFGAGTIAGMTALSAAIACPLARVSRLGRARRLVGAGAGAGSIAFGVLWALALV